MKLIKKTAAFTLIELLVCLATFATLIIGVVAAGGILYVAWHFIQKIW